MKSIIISIQQTKDLSYMHSLLLHFKANQVSFISIRFVYRRIQSVAISNTCLVYYFPNFLYYFPVFLLTSFLLLFAYNKNKIFMGSYFLGGFQYFLFFGNVCLWLHEVVVQTLEFEFGFFTFTIKHFLVELVIVNRKTWFIFLLCVWFCLSVSVL